MGSELKTKIEDRLSEYKSVIRDNDPVIKFIRKDHIGKFHFSSGLRMLPIELVEKYGSIILQDEREYKKYFDPSYDVYLVEWQKQVEGYWRDKLLLLETYLTPINETRSPLETYNHLNDLMIKIEKRSILLTPDPTKIVDQIHTRISGQAKDYKFIRSYWIDDDGNKKRMIARHIGDKFLQLEKEVMELFLKRGFGVIPNYRLPDGSKYDLVLQREEMKTVVEIKMINTKSFTNLFLFDELLKKFEEEYPKG